MSPRALALAILGTALCGCAAQPRPPAPRIDTAVTVRAVLADPRATADARVRWGGVIVHDTVGKTRSTLTVLAFPLAEDGRPRLGKLPYGRFLAISPGYLDPMLYGRGRLVSIVGVVTGTEKGMIGQAPYIYPTIRLLAAHLWRARPRPYPGPYYPRPQWNFGLGIGFGF